MSRELSYLVPCGSPPPFLFPTLFAVWQQSPVPVCCAIEPCVLDPPRISIPPKMSDPDSSSGTSPPHEIVVVPPPGHGGRQLLLDQCIDVRIDVFVHEQQFPLDVEVDEYVIFIFFQLAFPHLHSSTSILIINMTFMSTDKIRQQPISCSGWHRPLHQSGQSEPTEWKGQITTSSVDWLFSSRTGNITSGAISCSRYIDGSKTMRRKME